MVAIAGLAALAAPAVSSAAAARYHGHTRDLAIQGWAAAKVCADFGHRDVRCYDSDAAFRRDAGLPATRAAAAQSYASCPGGWACLWEHIRYGGRRLQWSETGRYPLARYGFRDKASAYRNGRNLYAFAIIDYRTGIIDPVLTVPLGGFSDWMGNQRYPRGGTWNDRADEVRL
jgi:hypothetical protein